MSDEDKRCPECGSWGWKCDSSSPVEGCRCVRCANAEIARLRGLLRELQWIEGDCPRCDRHVAQGHAPDCRLAAALKGEI